MLAEDIDALDATTRQLALYNEDLERGPSSCGDGGREALVEMEPRPGLPR